MTKRRDAKNRILRDRESQCKDGRYRYSYYENGKHKDVYSWKLNDSDTLPPGKRDCRSLRSLEQEILCRLLTGPQNYTNMSVLELTERYIKQKTGVRASTRAGYGTVLNVLRNDEFGRRKIADIRFSDAKLWLISLQERGKSYSAIHSIRGVVRPAFQMAVEDYMLVTNPFNFELASVLINDSVKREAITPFQERKFLQFIKADPHFSRYYDGIYILFYTGLRISEFCGLTLSDLDMKNKTISVNHQLQRTSKMKYIIEEPKSESGYRTLPMSQSVYECFQRILQNRPKPKKEPLVDGIGGFLYLDKNGMPMVALHWEKYFQHIVHKYNKTFKLQMPHITPHVCRHTYCSRMAKTGISPKTLQYLMGHSDISITLNVYTHLKYDDAKKELTKLKIVNE